MTDNTNKRESMTPTHMTPMQKHTANSIDELIRDQRSHIYNAFTIQRLMKALILKNKKEGSHCPSTSHVKSVLKIKIDEGMIYSPDGPSVYIVLGDLVVPALKYAELSVDTLVASGISGWIVSMAKIADRLKHKRVRAGLTQEKVARMVGTSPSTISLWESGGWNRYPELGSILPSRLGRPIRWKKMTESAEQALKLFTELISSDPVESKAAPATEPAKEVELEPAPEPAWVRDEIAGIELTFDNAMRRRLGHLHRQREDRLGLQQPESPPATSWVDLAKKLQAALPEGVQSVSITSSGIEYVEREWVESKKTL